MTTTTDLFAEARVRFTVQNCWEMLGLPGEPKLSCRSPFREDCTPSFSIHSDGSAWTDHGTGEGGDVIEFIRRAIKGDHRTVREWLSGKIEFRNFTEATLTSKPAKDARPRRVIQWPGNLIEGTQATWDGFAKRRGLTPPAVHVMVAAGILRFCMIEGAKCYVVTDAIRRAAEIRRIDGRPFGGSKAYPLPGVDKSWLPGAAMICAATPEASLLMVEGATDLLTAIDLYTRYKRDLAGVHSWVPVALLGAGCKNLSPECSALMRGRHVRIVPDADPAGDKMREHWTELLRRNACTVDCVTMPRDTDLTDHLATMDPTALFSK